MKPFLKSLFSWLAHVVAMAVMAMATYLLLIYWTARPMPTGEWEKMHQMFATMSVVLGLMLGTGWWLSNRECRTKTSNTPAGQEELLADMKRQWQCGVKMGCFDSIYIPCAACHETNEVQSKAGKCEFKDYGLHNAPPAILGDLDGETFTCRKCGRPNRMTVKCLANVSLVPDMPKEEEEW